MKISDLSIWESFYWVAYERSFSKAARRLRVGVPLLSKRISRLEEALGARLFFRTTRSVQLTSEGLALLPTVQTILGDLRELEGQFDSVTDLSGEIRLTCLPPLGHRLLAPVLAEFVAVHPRITFDLDLSDHMQNLVESRLDMAIRVQTPRDSGIITKKLISNDLVFCASPAYLSAAKRRLKTPEDLARHKTLHLNVHAKVRFTGSSTTVADVAETPAVRCNSPIFLTELALQGCGVALRAHWDVAPFLKTGQLVRVLENWPLEPFGDVVVAMPSRRFLAARVRAFADFLVEKAGHWLGAMPKT